MKKWFIRGAAVVLVVGLGTVGAGAIGMGPRSGGGQGVFCSTQSCRYTDADGDGVCDYLGQGAGFVDADGDGVCDRLGQGAGFVDADGDGVCDNRTGSGGGWRGGRWK